MQVKWGTNYSSPFTVTNGVRQGGVLSPYLFAVYLDELWDALWEIQGVHKVLHTLKMLISQKPHKVETLHFRQ